MSKIETIDIDTIDLRARAATPGPWEAGAKITKRVYIASSLHRIADTLSTADATFIAAARTDVPALVARVRELEARASLPVIATCDAPRLYTREEVLAYGEQVRAHMGDGLACGSADEYLPDAALSALLDAVKPLRGAR